MTLLVLIFLRMVQIVLWLSAQGYKVVLENSLADELHQFDLPVWFLQYEATADTARTSMAVLRRMVPGGSFLATDTLTGLLIHKVKVYEARPVSISHLK